MARNVTDRFGKVIRLVGRDALPRGLFLSGTDFHDQITARLQMLDGAGNKPVENREAARTAVERQMRLKIPNPPREVRQFFMGDVGRVA